MCGGCAEGTPVEAKVEAVQNPDVLLNIHYEVAQSRLGRTTSTHQQLIRTAGAHGIVKSEQASIQDCYTVYHTSFIVRRSQDLGRTELVCVERRMLR